MSAAADTVRELMRRGGEGGMAAVGLRPAVLREVREPVDPVAEQLKTMRETLDYLRLEPAERAQREAVPLVEAERHARQAAEAEVAKMSALLNAPSLPHAEPLPLAEPTERLRAFLAESEAQLASARVDVEAARLETQRIAAEAERLRAELRKPPPPPQERVIYREVALPQEVELEPKRDAAGRVERVTMRAAGYSAVNVDIVRGPDNRIAALRVRR